jgi:sulfhydrogenase subunit delta
MSKTTVGIFGLTSCAGDQLVILNCEDQLLDLANAVDIKDWEMAQTNNDSSCELDIALVEGSVAQVRDIETLKKIRTRCKILVALGTCAVWGGIPAMKNDVPREIMLEEVYGDNVKFIESKAAQPLSSFIKVDYNLPGCPIEKEEFLQMIASFLHGDVPEILNFSVCTECKMKENVCQIVYRKEVCCGPLTRAGCDARCPSHNVPCAGCHGPIEEVHYDSQVKMFKLKGIAPAEIIHKMHAFAAPAWMPEKLMEEFEHENE